jgi:hypothetical protein
MFEFFQRKLPQPAELEPTLSPEDYLAEAHRELRIAETQFAEAHFAVNQFFVRNRDFLPVKEVAGQVTITIKSPNGELAALLSRENRAAADRAKKMQRWSDLEQQFASRESRHIAGVRV